MEITYGGGSSFKLAGTRTISINAESGDKSEIRLFSRRQRSPRLVVNGPGEYEIAGVLIVTVPVGSPKGEHWAHSITLDDTSVLFLEGAIDALTAEALLAIGRVDVLIVEAERLAEAAKVVQDLTPRTVIPFGSHAPELCAALGVKDTHPAVRVAITAKTPRAALLKPPRGAGRKRSAA